MDEPGEILTQVSATGVLQLPDDVRAALGLEAGGLVSLRLAEGELRLRAVGAALRALQAEAAALVDDADETFDARAMDPNAR